jgi:hypothetical protein
MKRSALVTLGILLSAPSWAAGAGHPMSSAVITPPAPPHAIAVPPAVQPVAPNAVVVPPPPPHAIAIPPAAEPVAVTPK